MIPDISNSALFFTFYPAVGVEENLWILFRKSMFCLSSLLQTTWLAMHTLAWFTYTSIHAAMHTSACMHIYMHCHLVDSCVYFHVCGWLSAFLCAWTTACVDHFAHGCVSKQGQNQTFFMILPLFLWLWFYNSTLFAKKKSHSGPVCLRNHTCSNPYVQLSTHTKIHVAIHAHNHAYKRMYGCMDGGVCESSYYSYLPTT